MKEQQALKMGKPMYNIGKTANLKAQQRKQMDRDAKRRMARRNRASIKSGAPNNGSGPAESVPVAEITEGTESSS